MLSLSFLVALMASLSFARPHQYQPSTPSVEAIAGLTQGGYRAAHLLDTKAYDSLGDAMTEDVVYDSSGLGAYGGKSVGLDQVKAAVEAAFGDANVEHLVTNLYVEKMISPTKAFVHTYITYSHWDDSALDDITKTYRIYYKCDDIWVLQGGSWKMQYSNVTNMGPKVERPYFG